VLSDVIWASIGSRRELRLKNDEAIPEIGYYTSLLIGLGIGYCLTRVWRLWRF